MLPMILLGIRTNLKQDLKCSTAELVYGTTLRLPGEFFHSTTGPQLDPTKYVTQLKVMMQQLQPPIVRRQTPRKPHVSEDLNTCTHVFVRHDAVKKPLQQPYNGPYKVLKRDTKHFTLDVKSKHSVISVDRLKPAHMEDLPPVPEITDATTSPAPLMSNPSYRVTRSGRHVHWPKKLATCAFIASLEGE